MAVIKLTECKVKDGAIAVIGELLFQTDRMIKAKRVNKVNLNRL